MKILLGLGNPGPEYAGNRHNIGYRCVDRVVRRLGVKLKRAGEGLMEGVGQLTGEPLVVARSRLYMNRSGRAAREILSRHGTATEDLIVVHDDADLPLGNLRVKSGGGHGGHNGLRSIVDVLGERGFIRLRLGIGRPASQQEELADWVLADFQKDERATAETMAESGADAAEVIVTVGVLEAMNRFNAS